MQLPHPSRNFPFTPESRLLMSLVPHKQIAMRMEKGERKVKGGINVPFHSFLSVELRLMKRRGSIFPFPPLPYLKSYSSIWWFVHVSLITLRTDFTMAEMNYVGRGGRNVAKIHSPESWVKSYIFTLDSRGSALHVCKSKFSFNQDS